MTFPADEYLKQWKMHFFKEAGYDVKILQKS